MERNLDTLYNLNRLQNNYAEKPNKIRVPMLYDFFSMHIQTYANYCKENRSMFPWGPEDGGSGGEGKIGERIAKKHNETLWEVMDMLSWL